MSGLSPARRLDLIAKVLEREIPPSAPPENALLNLVDVTNPSHVWLAIAVMSGSLPTDEMVIETIRRAELDPSAIFEAAAANSTPATLARQLTVISNQVLVDVSNTARANYTTGIQRVVRECAQRWKLKPKVEFITWFNEDGPIAYDAMRQLTPKESFRMFSGFDNVAADQLADDPDECEFIIPWNCRIFIPELPFDHGRTARLQAMVRYTPNQLGIIGHDLIPLTTAETTIPDMPNLFARLAAALREASLIVTTSIASTTEFLGWRQTLKAIGVTGPRVEQVTLPVEAATVTESDLKQAKALLNDSDLPIVLVVGSHEPRKNHLAVLFAAEMLWGEGLQFSLVFIGGRSWANEAFDNEVTRLKQVGNSILLIRGADDPLLWSAYRLARFTVFPSLNEGFGLPVAESLAAGTPAITSNFGSMAEIAAEGGALLVDPRDDDSIIDAMRELLTNDTLLASLQDQAEQRMPRTWDQYAAEVWQKIESME